MDLIHSLVFGMKNFDLVSWYEIYTRHSLFFIHLILIIILIAHWFTAVFNYFSRNRWELRQEPGHAERYVRRIDQTYHFFAELFLLTGLAGTALVIQYVLKYGTLGIEEIRSIRQGIAFSAAGIALAVVCYLLRTVLLWLYRGAMIQIYRQRANRETDQIDELRQIRMLLFQMVEGQQMPATPLQEFTRQLGELKETFKSSEIQKQFASELGKVIDQWQNQSEERLIVLKEAVIQATGMLQETQKFMDRQIEHSDRFMRQLSEMKLEVSHTGTGIRQNMEELVQDITQVRQLFIEELKQIPVILKDHSETMITSMTQSQGNILTRFTEQTSAYLQCHRGYIDENRELIRASIDIAVAKSYELLQQSVEGLMASLHHRLEQEHQAYLDKLGKYHELIESLEGSVDVRVQEAAQIFRTELETILHYHRTLMSQNKERDDGLLQAWTGSFLQLNKLVEGQFIDKFQESTNGLNNALVGCCTTVVRSHSSYQSLTDQLIRAQTTTQKAMESNVKLLAAERQSISRLASKIQEMDAAVRVIGDPYQVVKQAMVNLLNKKIW
ncbi:MAG: hypothetical protein HQK58_00210 [Deltaproteobacteria bacterium]|nr:hypothetical protein [Deltaproteobacteria bacterium]